MKYLQENTTMVVKLTSALALVLVALYIGFYWNMDYPDFYTKSDIRSEKTAFLPHLLVLLPAFIGFWLTKRSSHSLVLYGFLAYLLILVLSYSSVFWAQDPLESGLLFVLVTIPFSLVLGLYLIYVVVKQSRL